MGKDISFGQYYPRESFVHRLDPRTKLVLVVAYIVAVFLCSNYYSYLAVIVFVLGVTVLSKVPLKSVLKSVRGILFLVLFTALINVFFHTSGERVFQDVSWLTWLPITWDGLDFAAKLALRLIILVVGTSLLTLTTTPMALTDGLESLMKPLKVIKFPVHDVALIMSIALRLIPSLMEEVNKIIMAQKARGASFDTGNLFKRIKAMLPILIPLFVSAFRKAEELALALDARCYSATEKRTKMKKLKFSWRDAVAAIFMALFIALVVAVANGFWLGLF